MNFPEDIVNQMTPLELENCDWDSLFRQIEYLYFIGKQSVPKIQSSAYREQILGFNSIVESKVKIDTRADIASSTESKINESSLEQKLHLGSVKDSVNNLEHKINSEMDNHYRSSIAHKSQLPTFPYYQWGLFEKAYLSPLSSPRADIKHTFYTTKFNYLGGFGKNEDILIARKPVYIPLNLPHDDSFQKNKKISLNVLDDENKIRNYVNNEIDIHNSQLSPKENLDEGEPQQKKCAYSCKICKEVYQTHASLLTHVKVHQQPFCKKCLSFFKTISNLRTHNRKFHPETPNYDDSDVNNNSSDNDEDRKNYFDKYNNISMKTVTSKYGRRRKVIDMAEIVIKKNRKMI